MSSRVSAPLAVVLSLLASPAAAQSTTEDGIRAVLNGDYQIAASILRPLADDGSRPDPVAQFFLAVLYEEGLGGRRDNGRACSLFARAASRSSPFVEQAQAISTSMQAELGTGAPLYCVADEQWQGGPPQSFRLGPNHRVVFADTSITVTLGDLEQRVIVVNPQRSSQQAIGHTPLAVARDLASPRHFFHWFSWVPDKPHAPSSWMLRWTLGEVVHDAWIWLLHENELVVVKSTTPPASWDTKGLVRVHLADNGEAAYTVAIAPSPRTVVIGRPGAR